MAKMIKVSSHNKYYISMIRAEKKKVQFLRKQQSVFNIVSQKQKKKL